MHSRNVVAVRFIAQGTASSNPLVAWLHSISTSSETWLPVTSSDWNAPACKQQDSTPGSSHIALPPKTRSLSAKATMSPCGMREVTKCTGFQYRFRAVGIARESDRGNGEASVEMASANSLAKLLRTLGLGALAGHFSLGRVPRDLVPRAPALEAASLYSRAVASPCGD